MNIFDIEENKIDLEDLEQPYKIIKNNNTYILKENVIEKIEYLIHIHKEVEQELLEAGHKDLAQISVCKIQALQTLLEIIRRV